MKGSVKHFSLPTLAGGVRILGLACMVLGVVLLVTYVVSPLRWLWWWFRHMPWPLQIGLGAAALGLCILTVSLLVERTRDRSYDKDLRNS